MLPPPLVAACRGELVILLKFQLQSAACRTSEMSGAANAAYLSPFPSTRLQAPLSPPLPVFGAYFPG